MLDAVFDGTMAPVFDPDQTLPVPGIVLAGDPASPDTIVRPAILDSLSRHSPELERRVVTGAGHMIHDSLAHRDAVLTAVEDLLARVGHA